MEQKNAIKISEQLGTHRNSLQLLDYFNAMDRNEGIGVSSKYRAINTTELAKIFCELGFEVTSVSFAGRGAAENRAMRKHCIRFRQQNALQNGVAPELVLLNSFDGQSSFNLKLGLFRLVCSNGLVTGKTYNSYKIRHVGDAKLQLQTAVAELMNFVPAMLNEVRNWQSVTLNWQQQLILANKIANTIAPDAALNIDATELLTIRRFNDTSNDLFTVMNVVQENVLRYGGLRYTAIDKNGVVKHRTMRKIGAVGRVDSFNQDIWDITREFYTAIAG